MTRLERILDGVGVADDATAPIRQRLRRRHLGRGPSDEDVSLCASMLRSAAATLEGALTLPVEDARTEVRAPALPDPPGEDLWFRKGPMA